jgi:hypothetical protein
MLSSMVASKKPCIWYNRSVSSIIHILRRFANYTKALYGFKQAPRVWFSRLSTRLLELHFTSSKADSSLFVYNAHGIKFFVLIYVDDIIITSSHKDAISRLISDLNSSFAPKDLGSLHFFLGVEATWSSDGLHLFQ